MTRDATRPNKPDELLLWLRGRYPNDTDEELTKRFREHARDDLAIVDRLSDFFLGLNFNRLLRSARAPRPESPKENAELQKRVNSLVDKWAVQHAERLKAAKLRRTQRQVSLHRCSRQLSSSCASCSASFVVAAHFRTVSLLYGSPRLP